MELREYQTQALVDLRRSIAAGHRRPVLQLPTGGGKTVIACSLIQSALGKQKRVLFLAPRRELIYQASRALDQFGIRHGVIMAGEPRSAMEPVQVASFDTLHARAIRRDKMRLPKADVVMVDEAHLSISAGRKKLLASYPDAVVVGLTATPARGDGRGLGEIYDDLVLSWPMKKLVDDGFLVPAKYYAPTMPDLEKIKLVAGDYHQPTLSQRMNQPKLVGGIVENWQRLAGDKQTVVFCVDRAHARAVHEAFSQITAAEYLDGETPQDERHALLERIASGKSQVLVNVFVATFGLDIPSLECAVLARPTRSVVLYLQTVGRVLRICEGKDHAVIIDHAGAVHEHGFADEFFPWTLDGNVRDEKQRQQEGAKEPKEITCGQCKTVFKGRRDCPSCGATIIPKSQDIPVHQADLIEIEPHKVAAKRNKNMSAQQKFQVYGELHQYARDKGYSTGWVSHKYREYFGVWPNRFKGERVPPTQVSEPMQKWIRSRQIAYAKRSAA